MSEELESEDKLDQTLTPEHIDTSKDTSHDEALTSGHIDTSKDNNHNESQQSFQPPVLEELERIHDKTLNPENKNSSAETNNSISIQSFQPPVSEELESEHISKRGRNISTTTSNPSSIFSATRLRGAGKRILKRTIKEDVPINSIKSSSHPCLRSWKEEFEYRIQN